MAAGAVGDEIQQRALRRMRHRGQRGEPGRGDRAGRQAGDQVSVVGVRLRQVGAGQRPRQRAESAAGAVGHGGIGLQPHAGAQPVEEHFGHQRTLRPERGLALDDAGQHQKLRRIGQRDARVARRPDRVQRAPHRRLHPGDQRRPGGAALERVGLGQDRTLGRQVEPAPQDRRSVDQHGDLRRSEAFRDGEIVLHRLCVAQDLQRAVDRHGGREMQLAGMQRRGVTGQAGETDEQQANGRSALQHAILLQGADDVAQMAVRHHDVGGLRQRAGPGGGVAHQAEAGTGQDHQHQQQAEQPAHQGPPPGVALRRRARSGWRWCRRSRSCSTAPP